MPDRIISDPNVRDALAVVAALVVGFIARTLTIKERFNLKQFIGEMILSAMMGGVIYLFGFIQSLGFWETLLIALLSGIGATRSLEWVVKASQSINKSGD